MASALTARALARCPLASGGRLGALAGEVAQ